MTDLTTKVKIISNACIRILRRIEDIKTPQCMVEMQTYLPVLINNLLMVVHEEPEYLLNDICLLKKHIAKVDVLTAEVFPTVIMNKLIERKLHEISKTWQLILEYNTIEWKDLYKYHMFSESIVCIAERYNITDPNLLELETRKTTHHPYILSRLYDIAVNYRDQGNDIAEPLLLRCLEGREKVLGKYHKDTLDTIFQLGIYHYLNSNFNMAEDYYLEALKGNEEVLGRYHKNTLLVYCELAILYRKSKQYEKELDVYSNVIAGYRTKDVEGIGLNNLGWDYYCQGKLESAEAIFRIILLRKERILGYDEKNTLKAVDQLADIYFRKQQYKKAEALYNRSLKGKNKIYGIDNINIISTVQMLETLYRQIGNNKKAKALREIYCI